MKKHYKFYLSFVVFICLTFLAFSLFTSCNYSGRQVIHLSENFFELNLNSKINDSKGISKHNKNGIEIIVKSSSKISNKDKEKILKELETSMDKLLNSIEGQK
jgi:hypothetical protein